MSAQPIPRQNFVDLAYRAIKQLIVSGELGPGRQLKIDSLSRELGVSNSPIREALRRLENERWVETIPFRGAFVRPFDRTELMELYELRELIELAALRKIMPHPDPAGIKRLAKALADIQAALQAGDQPRYLSADTQFHLTIVDMAGNSRLTELFTTLIEQGKCFMLGRTQQEMERYQDGRDDHVELFEAIGSGDNRRATQLLHRHLQVSVDDIRNQDGSK